VIAGSLQPTSAPENDPSDLGAPAAKSPSEAVWAILAGSVLLALAGIGLASATAMLVGGLGLVSGLALLGGARGRLVVAFAGVIGVCLFRLYSGDPTGDAGNAADSLASGLVWMLAGVWLFPILLWPVGFLWEFRRWKDS